MNSIGPNFTPQPGQFLSNANQVGMNAFVNTRSLGNTAQADAEAMQRALQQESAQLSEAAQKANQEEANKSADQKLENARQSGAANQLDESGQDVALKRKGKGKRMKSGQPVIPTGPKIDDATMQRLAHELCDADADEIEEIEDLEDLEDCEELDAQSPDDILEGVPDQTRAAASKMVENQPVDKLAGLKQIPQKQASELAMPELRPAALLPVELEPALLAEQETLQLELTPEEQAFHEQQLGEQALAAQWNGEQEMLLSGDTPPAA